MQKPAEHTLIFLLEAKNTDLQLSVLYIPNKHSHATMQLSFAQITQAVSLSRVGGHKLTDEDIALLSALIDCYTSNVSNPSEDSFSLSSPTVTMLFLNTLFDSPLLRYKINNKIKLCSKMPETPLQFKFHWAIKEDGFAVLQYSTQLTTPGTLFYSTVPLYITDDAQIYILTKFENPDQLNYALCNQKISYKQCAHVAQTLSEFSPNVLPTPPFEDPIIINNLSMNPVLEIIETPEDIFTPSKQLTLKISFRYRPYLFSTKPDSFGIIDLNGQWAMVKRNEYAEKTAIQELAVFGFFLRPASTQENLLIPTKAVNWDHFLTRGLSHLKRQNWEVYLPEDVVETVHNVSNVIVEFTPKGSEWFNLALKLDIAGTSYDLSEVISSLFKKEKRWLNKQAISNIDDKEQIYLNLKKGLSITISAHLLKPLALHILDFFDKPQESIHKLDTQRFITALAPFVNKKPFNIEANEFIKDFSEIQPQAIPPEIQVSLRDYQKTGVNWLQHLLKFSLGGILADDRGLGKTLQCITHLAIEHITKKVKKPSLIVVETSLLDKWQNEFKKFCPDLVPYLFYGKNTKVDLDPLVENSPIILTTYATFKQNEKKLNTKSWHLLLMDEAQNVKNFKTRGSKALNQLNCTQKICVTGTPIENNLSELWNLFNLTLPGFLGTYKEFCRVWKKPIEQENNTTKSKILSARCSPFILLRTKRQAAPELLEKTYTGPTYIHLDTDQKNLYDSIHVAVSEDVLKQIQDQGLNNSSIILLEALLKLRQICCDPALLHKDIKSAKRKKALELIQESITAGKKVLLFSQFRTMLHLLESDLKALNIKYSMIHGQTKKRQEQIDAFESGENQVFLISLKAGGKGLDLIAAQTVIIYDPWWNPAAEDQAIDRAHRLGQDKEVTVYKLICKNTVEEKVLELQQKKSSLIAAILTDTHNNVEEYGLSTSELLNILIST